jgi:hypothetical protein
MVGVLKDTFVSSKKKYSLGIEIDSGKKYLSFLTAARDRMIDYEVRYFISEVEYLRAFVDEKWCCLFIEECLEGKHEDVKISPVMGGGSENL